jgi:hypothetical protein
MLATQRMAKRNVLIRHLPRLDPPGHEGQEPPPVLLGIERSMMSVAGGYGGTTPELVG